MDTGPRQNHKITSSSECGWCSDHLKFSKKVRLYLCEVLLSSLNEHKIYLKLLLLLYFGIKPLYFHFCFIWLILIFVNDDNKLYMLTTAAFTERRNTKFACFHASHGELDDFCKPSECYLVTQVKIESDMLKFKTHQLASDFGKGLIKAAMITIHE